MSETIASPEENKSNSTTTSAKLADELQTIKEQQAFRAPKSDTATETQPEKIQTQNNRQTEQFINSLPSLGIEVEDTNKLRGILNNPDLFNLSIDTILDGLGMKREDARNLTEIATFKKELGKVTAERFREYIVQTDWRARLQPENLAVDNRASSESLAPTEVAAELENILSSSKIEFAQGTIWNMATSNESKWVAKFIKSEAVKGQGPVNAMATEMDQYGQVKEVFGDQALLEQVAVTLKDKETPILLQEKLNLEDWQPMGNTSKDVYAQVSEAIKANPQNTKILESFLVNINQLESEKGLILDFSGDNVVYRLDQNGLLDIKILDYGCTKAETDEADRVDGLHQHANTLRSLA